MAGNVKLGEIEKTLVSKKEKSTKTFPRIRLPWVITLSYLLFNLLLPTTALILKSLTLGWSEFWRIATSPESLSAYNVTFVTSLAAGIISGIMGSIVAWVMVRYGVNVIKLNKSEVNLCFLNLCV